MPDQPNAPEQTTQPRKLVLPAYPDEQQNVNSKLHVRPEQLIHPNTGSGACGAHFKSSHLPTNPLAKLQYFWRRDPAYKVLIIATVTVIVAGIIFTILGSIAFFQNSNGVTQDTIPQNPPSGTVDIHPTFPTPSGGNGSTTSSQPPAHGTPGIIPASPSSQQPTPSQSGSLIIAITNYPVVVTNNSKITVSVATNDIFAEVRLQVEYNAPPYSLATPLYPTDGSGNAIIPWRVHVRRDGSGLANATVVAIAIDQSSGQQNTSAPVEIRIDTTGG